MRLPEYVQKADRGVISRLSRESGLAYATVHACSKGRLLKRYETASRLSAATGGVVSVAELCDPPVAGSDPVPAAEAP